MWVVSDARLDGGETGTSLRQALGFMERGMKLFATMFYQKSRESPLSPYTYVPVIEYMFVFSKGHPKTINLIHDKPNTTAGTVSHGKRIGRRPNGEKLTYERKFETRKFGRRLNLWKYHTGGSKHGVKKGEHPAAFPTETR